MSVPGLLALALGASLLSGCSLIPDFARPAAPIPAGWPEGPAYRRPAAQPASAPTTITAEAIHWRDFFRDARLQRVIAQSLEDSRDLRIAALNIASYEALYRVQRGDLFPQVGGFGSLTAARSRINPLFPATTRSWSAGIGFTAYEIDLFGRVRSLTAQAFAQYLGYYETRRSTQISLVANVANVWMAIAADQELLAVTQQTLTNQEDAYRLTLAGYNGGNVNELVLRQAETSVGTAQANLAAYTRQLAQDVNALDLAVGGEVAEALLPTSLDDERLLPPEIPEGLSSNLLLRRPDVLAAEQNLIAANANIGAARAAFFPSLTLTASAGTSSNGLNRLFGAGTAAWNFAPQLNIPIFSAGINQANLDLSRTQREVQVATYEATIQTAFREVADALAGRGTYAEQIAAQSRLVAAYEGAYRLALLRFRGGLDSFTAPLDSQRQLYAAQQTLVSLRLARLQNLVTLYKALGGGW